MTYAGLVIRVKSHFENCNNGPEETPAQGDCSYILNVKKNGTECDGNDNMRGNVSDPSL